MIWVIAVIALILLVATATAMVSWARQDDEDA